MITYVLVHGGSVTGHIWDPVSTKLISEGNNVFAPNLYDERVSNLTDHISQVCELISKNNLVEIILVGHSYGGMVITGVASKLSQRIKKLVYIDAALPSSGQSLFDLIKLGGKEPLSFEGLEALPPYIEPLTFDENLLQLIPKCYIRCTRSEFGFVSQLAKDKIAYDKNWVYMEIETAHNPMRTMPDKVLDILFESGK